MPYIADRVAHDADAHLMETPNWLRDHADPAIRDRIGAPGYSNELKQTGDETEALDSDGLDAVFARLAERHRSEEFIANELEEVMSRKNFAATGSFLAEDRPRVLDMIGVRSQLLFNTFHNSRLYGWEHGGDLDLAYGAARAHNRGMVEFCSVDPRLLPTCYVPLAEFDRSAAMAAEAIEMGAAALLVASGCPAGHSPSHLGLDPVWRQAEEAGLPIVFHVGGTGTLIDPNYFENGLPIPADFHGGEENFRSVDYMGIPGPPMQTLATMIFDGVLDRFPDLRIGVIEQGCIWLPSWMKQMESAFDAFHRHEERLQRLSLRPSEFVERQIRVTPYPTEDVGWVTAQVGPNVLLFNTDFPHVEGGRRPYERFEASLGDAGEDVRQRFYADNFVDLMGTAIDRLPAPV
jgi:predicted TIM-barrel fold metal-dependent hydrolase